jgi:ADP-ribose pyrophosphatase YjhB (NUDIX family)
MSTHTLFQYCPKFVLFSEDQTKILFAKRKGEQDYDGVYSLIGGKTETTDQSLLAGLRREKDEEIGASARVRVCWKISCYQILFRKKDGNSMIIPHHVALYKGGHVQLNPDEYADYKWIPINEFPSFEPKIANNIEVIAAAQRLLPLLTDADFDDV